VLYEFQLSAHQLIHISDDTVQIPQLFVDIYPSQEAYEDRRTPSFNQLLVAKGLARGVSNEKIVSWLSNEGSQPVESSAVASLRWVDIHELQMPVLNFGATGTSTLQSYSHNFVVGNVTVMETPPLSTAPTEVATKQVDTKVPLPSTTADRLYREKMERVDRWLKQEAKEQWKHVAAKMRVETSGAAVPPQSSVMTSSAASNPQKPRTPRRLEMYDTPEKDVNRHEQTQPNWTKSSENNSGVNEFMNLQPSNDGEVKKSSASKSEPSGGWNKTRSSFGDGQQEKPLFLRDDSAYPEHRSYGVADKKADSPEIHNSATPKPAHDNTFGGHSPQFCASDIRQHAKTSPSEETKLNSPSLRPVNEKSIASTSSQKSACNEEVPLNLSASADLDNHALTSTTEHLNPLIPTTSFCAVATNASPNRDANEEEDACSEFSDTSLSAVEIRMESDAYLTANESSSVSVTPQKKTDSVPTTLPPVTPSPEVSHGTSSPTNDEETVVPNTPVAAEEPNLSRAVAPVKLEIPESRRVTVLVSEVESPHRFWVNVASEECCIQMDHVTEMLNDDPSSLRPVDETTGSIGLHQCYCVQRNDKDRLVYRAEIVEICYGDDRCKRSSADDGAICQCDQLMRSSATAPKAAKVP